MSDLFYKRMLNDVLEMKRRGLTQLHLRVRKLIAVFEDPDFRHDIQGDDFRLASYLNKYVDDCALTFLELRAVMEKFPDDECWTTYPLRTMYDMALESAQPIKQQEPLRNAAGKSAAPTASQVAAIEKRADTNEALVKQVRSEIEELRSENARLVSENDQLKKRIADLEHEVERLIAAGNADSARSVEEYEVAHN